jgi:hypothetical protein
MREAVFIESPKRLNLGSLVPTRPLVGGGSRKGLRVKKVQRGLR